MYHLTKKHTLLMILKEIEEIETLFGGPSSFYGPYALYLLCLMEKSALVSMRKKPTREQEIMSSHF